MSADTSLAMPSPAASRGHASRAAHGEPHHSLRRPVRARQHQSSSSRAGRSAPSSGPTAPARAPSSTASPACCARPPGAFCSTARTSPALSPDRISQKGIARSYQITNILPNATTLENVRIAAQSRRHGWNMFSHHGNLARHHRQGGGGAGRRRPHRQGRRARRQPLARPAAQSRDRHRARHRAAAALPRRADRGHEHGRDPRHHGAGAAHRAGTSPS